MMFGKFIDSSTVTGTQIRLDNEQWLRGRNFANTGDLNILRINSSNQIEFKQIPYVEGQGRLALYSELDGILTSVEYLYGQLSEVTGDIATIQGDIVDIQAEIDALQEEVGDFAFKDLSNLTATAIPSGINLESVSIDQTTATGFALRTKNQTTSVSGRVQIRTGTADGSFSSGAINIESGVVTNALGASTGTIMTGSTLMTSGSISSGTRGSSGSSFVRTGSVVASSATSYSGNSGTVGVSSGPIAALVTGATVTGTTGFASLITGSVSSQAASATANASSGNILVSTGGISTTAEGAIVNGNTGSATFSSGSVSGGFSASGTSNSSTGQVNFNSGNITNANNTGNTGSVNIFSGSNSGTGGSGSLSISTGQSSISGNTGNININTGVAVSGTQGDIRLTAPFVKFLQFTRLILEDNSADQIVRLQLKNAFSEGNGEFFFNRIRSDKSVFIGAMESHVDDNGAPVYFSGTFLLSDNDGQYKTSDVYLQTLTNSGFRDAPNVAVSTGDIYIKTESSFVQGTETDANTGNITLQTGTPSGAGTKGYISLNADYITANSTQLKNLADGTDPQDAATVSQLGGISGSFALTDLSNLVSPTLIPDGVGLNSVSTTSFSISTSDSITTDPTGAIDINTGDINNVASSANSGDILLHSGNSTSSGNSGSVNIYSGDNTGSGNTGNINIATGQRAGNLPRGAIFLNGQGTNVSLRNYDVTGDHSLFNIGNDSPGGGGGSIQFLTYAKGNNTMGMRIFDSSSSSGFSIQGWGRVNQNGGAFNFESTGVQADVDGTHNGGDFNILSGSIGYINPLLGLNATINSGNVNINTADGYITGSNTDANSGNINLTTGQKTGSGIRGNITMNSKETTIVSDFVKLQNYTRLVLEDNTGDQLVRLQLTSPTAEGYGQFFFNRIRSNKSVFIGAMESHVDDNGAPVHFSGTFLLSDTDGQYKTSDVYLQTLTNSGFRDAPNVAVSTGDIYIKTESSFVQGTETDANTGNITLQTGTPSGAGTKGYISLNADYITANSTQLKNLADGTDPQDAVTLSQLQAATGGGGGDFANRDLSNLVGPTAIPANVGLISLQSRPVLAPMASFDISTAAQSGTDGSGGLRLHSGNIFNITSAQSTGFVALSTGLTLGSGNTGDISIFSGDNVGSGNSGNVNISTGASVAGTRGDVVVNARNIIMQANGGTVQAKQELLVLDNAGLNYSHIGNQDPNFSFMVVGAFDSPIHASVIGPWKSIGQSGGYASFHGSYVQGTVDGTFKASDVYLESKTAAGGAENTADNLEISSGNITVRSHDAFIKGTGANANTGNITLQTGAAQGSGTKGYILLSGSFVSANLTQIKNVANATDPGDAVNLSQLDAKTRAGSVSIPNASNTVTVTFSSDIGTSNYSVNLQIQNTVDASPLFLDKVITSQSSTGFTIKFSQNTDSANYNVQYVAQLFN